MLISSMTGLPFWRRVLVGLTITVVLVFSLQSCASLIASKDKLPPDTSKIYVGAPRPQIEKELGPPREDMRTDMLPKASRKVSYRYVYRTPLPENPSWWDKFKNSLVGIEGKNVTVYYDRHNLAVKIIDKKR